MYPDLLARAKVQIAGIESGGNYGAQGPVTNKAGDRAYGKYQVMSFNIPSWTKEALGKSLTPAQFLADPSAQEKVFEHKFGQYIQQYGTPENAAKVWFGGPGALKNGNATDILGTSVNEYAQRFSRGFGFSPAPTGQNASAGGYSGGGSLTGFASAIDQAVNLAKQRRNSEVLSLMGPHQGTAAASDFTSILGNLNKASDTFSSDLLKRAGLDTESQTKLNEPLSVSEAQALGLPYGTTRSQAMGQNITPKKAETEPKEYQHKANLFVQRMQDADKVFGDNQTKVVGSNPIWYSVNSLAENTTLGNTAVPALIQTQRQAERNFLNAVLRRESGAVISPSEFADGARQYFPRPGDSDEVLLQKTQNRQRVIQSMQQEAGGAYQERPSGTSFSGILPSGLRYTVTQ